ncbi:DUF4911 domain-containing protein [Acetomicrobium sp.]|uniref:DUF4911 domain-containing protein n=1 Tax=Acetomicrobium sp. TaxID=1872099 RepID=UPI001BD177B2|nr:DUF4911 domain-containing protein [Acetomicrobium sp.]
MVKYKKALCKLLLRIDEFDIFYLSAVVDGYDNLGYVRKEEAPDGHVWLYYAGDMEEEVYELISLLRSEIDDFQVAGGSIRIE